MIDNRIEYVYVLLSQTPTKFGKVIRKTMNLEYNHASIAFDEKLETLYSFARIQQKSPVVAGLVKEYPERISLRMVDYVPVKIYKIPVDHENYMRGLEHLNAIMNDKDGYLYNLFSVLTFPLLNGIDTYKAFSCVEFTAYMLMYMGVPLPDDKKRYEYTPEDLGSVLDDYLFFKGNLLDYCDVKSDDTEVFFDTPNYFISAAKTTWIICRLIFRKIRH